MEDLGSIPGLGRSPGEGNGNPLQYFAWKISWTEEPGRLQSMGSQSLTRLSVLHACSVYSPWGHKESDTTEQLALSLSEVVKMRNDDSYLE